MKTTKRKPLSYACGENSCTSVRLITLRPFLILVLVKECHTRNCIDLAFVPYHSPFFKILERKLVQFSLSIHDILLCQCSFASSICRQPFLDDNREGIRRLDERAFLSLVQHVTFIRDAYGKMHDVITKNIPCTCFTTLEGTLPIK